MAVRIETQECFPKPFYFGQLLIAEAPEPNHEACQGSHTVPGLIGGWMCPCPCHRKEAADV